MQSFADLAGWPRYTLIIALLLAVGVSFVAFGTVDPNPAQNAYPGTDEVVSYPDEYVGERVSLSGTVVATDPLVITADSGVERARFTVTTSDHVTVAEGDQLIVFGTLTATNEVQAERTVVREPWELTYMYVVSFLGGLLVLARLLRHWRPDLDHYALVPWTESTAMDGER
ncbi:hypothetical protein HUG10_07410 [Halorarum halophilum]|uniref:Uncharacterized protein n=1 Tax=Halorarum halophilum TaxID=2743090 RepID=A0A7D5GBJ1_9EURY|nr:hypothetical protein [Halobaculum halophilum]QLG27385.1 hypothetical protein HUG10_07410 [Halobaculum halophilum]